jgi:type VI secretion system protein VasI
MSHAAWRYGEGKDRLEGSWYAVIADAKETVVRPQRRPEETNKTAELHLWCREGKASLFYKIENALVGSSLSTVSYRFDEKPPVKDQDWGASADNTSLGFWKPKQAISLSKQILNSKKLFIRTQDSVFGQTEAEFDLTGLDQVVKPLRESCKW